MTAPVHSSGDPLRERLAAAIAPNYTVIDEIGRGGMSVVFRARDERLRRDVAIKLLPPELAFVANVRERFMREAQTAAQLAHPNIVPIYGVEVQDALVWIVMAMIEGETLGTRLARDGKLSAPEAERILRSVSDALGYAHTHGVIHRDIKPDNILLERETLRVLVTDFGIARAAEGDARLTLTGVAVGTPAYMSPEQAIGEGEIDGRSDLYSLGIVGYQMLAGAPPFTANSTPALLLKHVSDQLPSLRVKAPSAPVPLVSAIERALAKKPADRWPTVGAFAAALRGEPSAATEPPPLIGVPAVSRAATEALRQSAPPPLSTLPAPARPAAVPPRLPQAGGLPVPPRPPVPLAGANAVPAWVYGVDAGSPSIALQATAFRRKFFSTMGTISFLGIVNAVTSPQFAWVIFPAFGMLMGLSAKWRPLGDAGLSFMDVVQNREAVRNAGVEGAVPAQLFSKSLAGRARRFASRMKTAAIAAGVATVSLIVGNALHIAPLAAVFAVSSATSLFALISASNAARPLRALGFRRRELLNGTWRDSEAARAPGTAFRLREEEVSQLAAPDVVMSAHGERLRLAVDDRTAIRQQLSRLGDQTPGALRDVLPTVHALVERIGALSSALFQLDRDLGAAGDGTLDQRIDALRKQGAAGNDRTLGLLLQQRESLAQLEGQRATLRAQLESASLALQTLRLDVLRLGSMGLAPPVVRDVGQATEQARALSKDLAYLLDGIREADRT